MKKSLFYIGMFLLTNYGISQSTVINSSISPIKSRGYLNWENYQNATSYRVKIFLKDENGTYQEIDSYTTEKTYIKIDLGYLQYPNAYYTIAALNTSGTTISIESTPTPVNPDYQGWQTRCSRTCIGNTYAWRLNLIQQGVNLESIPETAPAKLSLTDVASYQNTEMGINVPYFQAIDMNVYNLLPTTHPYKTPAYHKILINEELVNSAGPFMDAQNNTVSYGYLIEKKMDQFDFLNAHSSNIFSPASTECNNTLDNWITRFNNGNTYTGTPPTVSPFVINAPYELSCASTGVGSTGGSGNSGNPTSVEDMIADWEMTYACWYDENNLSEFLECMFGSANNGNGFAVTDVVFEPISSNIIDKRQQHFKFQSNFNSRSVTFSDGLYEVYLFGNNGTIFNFTFDHQLNSNNQNASANVNLAIMPNPIENNRLNLSISSSLDEDIELLVYTLNNEIIHDETIYLSTNNEIFLTIPITVNSIPYNQIRVVIEMKDGSKIIKTGYVNN